MSLLAGRSAVPAARGAGWARLRAGTGLGAVALFLAVAAAHAAGAAVVYQFGHRASAGEVFFPAAGVTVAALLLVPRRWWPVVLAAAFGSELAAHVILGEVAGTAIGSALAHTAEPALGAALVLRTLGGRPQLSRHRDLTTFVLCAAVVAPVLGGLIGAVATRFTHQHGPFLTVFARWWTGGALGVLIVGSLILAWLAGEASPVRSRHAVFEGSLLAVTTCLVTWLAFWRWPPELAYLALVPLGWAAIRFGTRGATAAGAVIAVLAEWATATDHGLFAAVSHTHDRALWFLQLFLAVVFLGGLMMAAAVAAVSRAEATALRASKAAERDTRLAVSDAHAAERNRLARELHDSVSQALFSMTMHASTAQLALAKAGLAENPPAARAVARLRTLTAGALAEMRALIFELRPGALAEEGLVSALRRQATAICAREEAQITIDGPDSRLNLAPAAEEHAYRLVLEAWHNTVKHARAAAITTTITADTAAVTVQVNDNGRGFDPASVPPGHLGLQTMRERAAAIGATFHLASAPGKGTTITFQVPSQQPRPGPAMPPSGSPGGQEIPGMTSTPAPAAGLTVFLVDDHAIVRSGVSAYLDMIDDITVAGEAGTGQQALDRIAALEPAVGLPDVVLMDLLMPGMDGIEATRQLKARWPVIEVVAVTSFLEEAKVRAALEAGAAGYLLKDAQADEVAAAIRAAAAGECHLDPAAAKLLAASLRAPRPAADTLTAREREVLTLIAEGMTNRQIARQLNVTERTARTHVSNILAKLQLTSRTQAALWAVQEGLAPARKPA